MLTLPEGRPQQAARFGVQHEEVARKAYVAWRREAMILGTGGSRIFFLVDVEVTWDWKMYLYKSYTKCY